MQAHLVVITVLHKVELHLDLEFLQPEAVAVVNLELIMLLAQEDLVDPEAEAEEWGELIRLQVDLVIIHQHHLHKEILADQEQMLQETGEEPEAVAEEPLNQEAVLLVHTILEMEEMELEQQ